MRKFLPLEIEGSHALGAKMATVACGMSSEMRKRYITSTAAELKTPAGLRMRTRRRRKPRRTHKLMPSFRVRTNVGFCRPVCGHKSPPGALATSCGCDACRCAGSWAQSSGRSWTACQPSARVPAVQLTIPLQSHSPAYWSYHSSTTRVLTWSLCAPLRIRSYTPGLGRAAPRQCVMPKSFTALKMNS